jgi:hypothetical protein
MTLIHSQYSSKELVVPEIEPGISAARNSDD